MRTIDVIAQLASELPIKSTNFTENFDIVSVTISGTTATVTTSTTHGLLVNRAVNVISVPVPVEIGTVTDNLDGTISIETVTAHDLTKNNNVATAVNARITGPSYDETFEVTQVSNRENFLVSDDGQPIPVAGYYLQEQFISAYNGLQIVTSVPSTASFTYELTESLPDATDVTGAKVTAFHRISGAVNYEIAKQAYTSQPSNSKYWLFVVINDTSGNKDRSGTNDAAATRGKKQAFFQQIIEGFTLYLFVPNKGDTLEAVSGAIARDNAIDERLPILQSVLGIQYNSELSFQGQYTATYDADGFWEFTGAYYVHSFQFQQVSAITNSDTAIQVDSRAFRDINFTFTNLGISSDTDPLIGDVDLDDVPIT